MSPYFMSSILCLSSLSFPATTPRATTPHPYHHGLSCLCIHPGYHAIVYFYSLVITPELSRSTTLTRTSGYCTRHSSSYFVVYLSPAITPPVLLHLHHHRGTTRTNLLHTLATRSNGWAVRCITDPCRRRRQRRRGTRVLLGQCTS